MNSSERLSVEVVYAGADGVSHVHLQVLPGTSILQAILQSGLDRTGLFDLTQCRVGIFGQLHRLDDLVSVGARIEIYRPLQADPKEARRRRALHRKRA